MVALTTALSFSKLYMLLLVVFYFMFVFVVITFESGKTSKKRLSLKVMEKTHLIKVYNVQDVKYVIYNYYAC